MDGSKYLEPKFSLNIEPLVKVLKKHFMGLIGGDSSFHENDKISTITSNISALLDTKSEISMIMGSTNKSCHTS